ncbi:MAG TPA: DUF1320 family protein, partial [Candidatus Paceibacterota bacterium]|nr:DUF1320 family protein [Candidatus Paceibacterota bacterium]
DPGLLSAVIEAASNEVDALIEGRVRLPVSSPPQKLRTAALYLALEILFIRRALEMPAAIAAKIKWWRDWLSKVGAGEMRLEAPDADAPAKTSGGAIATLPSLTGTGGLISALLFMLSVYFTPAQAIEPRTFSFLAPENALESEDQMDFFQAESIRLQYSLASVSQDNGSLFRWEVMVGTNRILALPPTSKLGRTLVWNASPLQTYCPAGLYFGRVAAYVTNGTNLVFHRVISRQRIRIFQAPSPDGSVGNPGGNLFTNFVSKSGGDTINYDPPPDPEGDIGHGEEYALSIFSKSQHDHPRAQGLRVAAFPHTNTTYGALLRLESGSTFSNLESRFVVTTEGQVGINVGRPEYPVHVNMDTYFGEDIFFGKHSFFRPRRGGPPIDDAIRFKDGLLRSMWLDHPGEVGDGILMELGAGKHTETNYGNGVEGDENYIPPFEYEASTPRLRVYSDGKIVTGGDQAMEYGPDFIRKGEKEINFENGTISGFNIDTGCPEGGGGGTLSTSNTLANNSGETILEMHGSWSGDGYLTVGDVNGWQGHWVSVYNGVDDYALFGNRSGSNTLWLGYWNDPLTYFCGTNRFTINSNGPAWNGVVVGSDMPAKWSGYAATNHVLPDNADAYSIGSLNKWWKNIHLGSNGVHIGRGRIDGNSDGEIAIHVPGAFGHTITLYTNDFSSNTNGLHIVTTNKMSWSNERIYSQWVYGTQFRLDSYLIEKATRLRVHLEIDVYSSYGAPLYPNVAWWKFSGIGGEYAITNISGHNDVYVEGTIGDFDGPYITPYLHIEDGEPIGTWSFDNVKVSYEVLSSEETFRFYSDGSFSTPAIKIGTNDPISDWPEGGGSDLPWQSSGVESVSGNTNYVSAFHALCPSNPVVILTLQDIGELAGPVIVSTTPSNFTWGIRSSAGWWTNVAVVNWTAGVEQ